MPGLFIHNSSSLEASQILWYSHTLDETRTNERTTVISTTWMNLIHTPRERQMSICHVIRFHYVHTTAKRLWCYKQESRYPWRKALRGHRNTKRTSYTRVCSLNKCISPWLEYIHILCSKELKIHTPCTLKKRTPLRIVTECCCYSHLLTSI